MPIQVAQEDRVALVTVDRPERLNALNTQSLQELLATFERLASDSSVRAIIVTGAGDRAFIAGADIAEMKDKSPSEALAFARLGQAVCSAIEAAPQPVIAAINGYALGGGCEIALACDIRLASETAVLGQPEVALGVPPGWGGTQRLPRVIGPGLARELIYTGRRVRAEEALRIGLVNAVYPPAELLERARALAAEIARNAPLAVRLSKEAIRRGLDVDLAAGLALEAQAFALAFSTADQREGMSAFLEKRSPEFRGA
ncbi:enoyl-CoA hydratase-related protein [Thermomicrobiaceae bacterium CFH 74404]|uniref:Enoyl-CoA hydratase-related protein n=1 Tax=Thermalbibacter longus TaxID=2951981 RepID=A0AA42BAQ1_9BACT|nr:enoyl-CoA hydratase-related protein [Thermalbibacter longus]MCM8750091.1 enoyl-CoA hydratase-related protein [Thermalbibacter longus]